MIVTSSAHETAGNQRRGMRLPHPGWFLLAAAMLLVMYVGLLVWLPQRRVDLFANEVIALNGKVDFQPAEPFRWSSWIGYDINLGFRDIATVSLMHSKISDAWLERLEVAPRLRALTLRGPDVTDAGLVRVAGLHQLESLMLIDCPKVTSASEELLLRNLPNLRIEYRGPVLLGVSCNPSESESCIVGHTPENCPAKRAGILPGDVIQTMNGAPIPNFPTLVKLLAEYKPGDTVSLDVQRGNQSLKFEIELQGW